MDCEFVRATTRDCPVQRRSDRIFSFPRAGVGTHSRRANVGRWRVHNRFPRRRVGTTRKSVHSPFPKYLMPDIT